MVKLLITHHSHHLLNHLIMPNKHFEFAGSKFGTESTGNKDDISSTLLQTKNRLACIENQPGLLLTRKDYDAQDI